MHARLKVALLVLGCGIVSVARVGAEGIKEEKCPEDPIFRVTEGQPFLINDPRTDLMLFVESDGRHMAAIDRNGKIVWHRNLFDDPRLDDLMPPPPPIEGEPPVSAEDWRRATHAYVKELFITLIAVQSDCQVRRIDHHMGRLFHGHYIFASSWRHVFYLLDAKTGDFLVSGMN